MKAFWISGTRFGCSETGFCSPIVHAAVSLLLLLLLCLLLTLPLYNKSLAGGTSCERHIFISFTIKPKKQFQEYKQLPFMCWWLHNRYSLSYIIQDKCWPWYSWCVLSCTILILYIGKKKKRLTTWNMLSARNLLSNYNGCKSMNTAINIQKNLLTQQIPNGYFSDSQSMRSALISNFGFILTIL